MSDLYRKWDGSDNFSRASRSDVLEWLLSDRQSLLELRKALRKHGFEEGLRAALIAAMKAVSDD